MQGVYTTIGFEAAHRLYDVATYSEECRDNIHGHSYKVSVKVMRPELNEAGMVMDFKLLKKILKETIEDKYDHSCIVRACDPLSKPLQENCKKVHVVEENPTAEWMAESFAREIETSLKAVDPKLFVDEVHVQETENNLAVWRRDVKYQAIAPVEGHIDICKTFPVREVTV